LTTNNINPIFLEVILCTFNRFRWFHETWRSNTAQR